MGGLRIAAPLRKCHHFQNADPRIERDGEHIARFDAVPGRGLPRPIKPDMALGDKFRSAGAGADDPRVEQPFIDALVVQP